MDGTKPTMSQLKVKVRDTKTMRAPEKNARAETMRKITTRTKGPSPWKRYGRSLAISVLLVMTLAFPWWLWSSGVIDRVTHSLKTDMHSTLTHIGFSLEDLIIEGRHNTPAPKILEALGVRKGDSLFQIDLDEARGRFEAMPWVRAALLSRRLPGVLYVRLSEHQPVALFQENGKLFYVNDRGETFGQALEKYMGQWMVVTGPDAPIHAPALLKALEAFPDLKKRLTGALFMGKRRWDLMIDGNLRLKLPEEQMEDALRRFIQFDQQSSLHSKDIVAVDLRFPDKTYFQLTPEGAKLRKAKSGAMIKS